MVSDSPFRSHVHPFFYNSMIVSESFFVGPVEGSPRPPRWAPDPIHHDPQHSAHGKKRQTLSAVRVRCKVCGPVAIFLLIYFFGYLPLGCRHHHQEESEKPLMKGKSCNSPRVHIIEILAEVKAKLPVVAPVCISTNTLVVEQRSGKTST